MDGDHVGSGTAVIALGSLWKAIQSLRPAFSNATTFMWFATVVAGTIVRVDLLGVTSIVRALNLRPELYHALLRLFHSTAVKLDRLTALWAHTVLLLFPSPVRVNSRLVLVGDGVKIPKRGKKMPAVAKFIADRQDTQNMRIFRMSA